MDPNFIRRNTKIRFNQLQVSSVWLADKIYQPRGVFRRGAQCAMPPPLWIASKVWIPQNSTQKWALAPFWNLGRKSRQKNGLNLIENLFWGGSPPKSKRKNGLNLSEDFFLIFIFASLELRSFCSGFYLPFQIPASPPFENSAYTTVSTI